MKNQLGCTFFPTHSSDTAFRYKPASQSPKTKSPFHKPCIFTQEIVFSSENEERISGYGKHVAISLEKLTYQKFRQQKEMLENARLPSFHIKRLIDRSNMKKKEAKPREPSRDDVPGSPKKQIITQEELKKYWQNYLSSESVSSSRTPKGFLSPLGKDKNTRSELSKELSEAPKGQKGQKQSFFVNNFIRTTYRRRKDNKARLGHELSLRDRRDALLSHDLVEDSMNQMAPWEKENEEEDGFHFQESPFNSK